ncbi:MAG: hypothetical protein HRU06_14725 [Oceanospirillaceae bacterium]|nr:hypothetical protein [Oceanospirillaceae bacterium]
MSYLIIIMTVISLLSGGVNYWQYQQQQTTSKQLAVIEQTANDRLLVIENLQANAQQQAAHVKALNRTQTSIRHRLAKREQLLRSLKDEYQDYKRWASIKLPAITQRLRQRPAITGASAYQQHLSNNNPLQPNAEPPAH